MAKLGEPGQRQREMQHRTGYGRQLLIVDKQSTGPARFDLEIGVFLGNVPVGENPSCKKDFLGFFPDFTVSVWKNFFKIKELIHSGRWHMTCV